MLTSATIANPRGAGRGAHRLRAALVDRDGAPHAEREVVMWNPPLVDEQLGKRALGARRGGGAARRARRARRAHDLLPQVAARRRADPAVRAAAPRGHGARRRRRADRPLPRRLHAAQRREIERRLAEGRAAGGGRHRRARARHRRRRARRGAVRDVPRHGGAACARCGAAPGGATRAWRCTWPARTRSTSSSAATPTSSSSGRWSGRSSTTSRRRSTSRT